MPKRRVAVWYKIGRVYTVRPPDWPRDTEYSCTEQETLIEWAHNHNYVLRDGNVRRGNSERYSARKFG
mgnify:FL=1